MYPSGWQMTRQNSPCMWQQQQQQSQFISRSFAPFSMNFNNNLQHTNTHLSNPGSISRENNHYSSEPNQPKSFYFEREEGNNRISYERNRNQQQYASYPRDAVYRHESGPGWQRQEVSYPLRRIQ